MAAQQQPWSPPRVSPAQRAPPPVPGQQQQYQPRAFEPQAGPAPGAVYEYHGAAATGYAAPGPGFAAGAAPTGPSGPGLAAGGMSPGPTGPGGYGVVAPVGGGGGSFGGPPMGAPPSAVFASDEPDRDLMFGEQLEPLTRFCRRMRQLVDHRHTVAPDMAHECEVALDAAKKLVEAMQPKSPLLPQLSAIVVSFANALDMLAQKSFRAVDAYNRAGAQRAAAARPPGAAGAPGGAPPGAAGRAPPPPPTGGAPGSPPMGVSPPPPIGGFASMAAAAVPYTGPRELLAPAHLVRGAMGNLHSAASAYVQSGLEYYRLALVGALLAAIAACEHMHFDIAFACRWLRAYPELPPAKARNSCCVVQ